MVQKAGASGAVYLLADQGAYNLTGSITITHGGAEGAPITIQGVNSDGSAAHISINGTRDPNWTPTSNSDGNTIFKLNAGASNVDFEHIDFNNVGMAFNIGADLHNVTLGDMHADNVRYFAGNYPAGGASTANVTGLYMHDVDVHGFSKSVLILKGDAHDIHVDHVYGDGEYQDGDTFEMGISLQGTVHDVTISNSTMKNCIAVGATGDYTNGDGFVTERGNYNITYINCAATGNGDGGFDLKSSNTVLTDCYSEDNKRNYRIWGDNVTLNNDIGVDPHKHVSGTSGTQCNLWISSNASNVTVNGGSFVDSGSATHAISNEGGGLYLNRVNIVHASSAILLDGGSRTTGLDMSLVVSVAATGSYSTDGEQYLIAPLITVSDASVTEGGDLVFTLTRSGDLTRSSTVEFQTADDLAHAPDDYSAVSGSATFGPGELSQTVTIHTIDDSTVEAPETLSLQLTGGTNVRISGGFGTGTIADNDFDVGTPSSPDSTPGTWDLPDNTWNGTSAANAYHASDSYDWTLCGNGGNDTLIGGAGNDTIKGGSGSDQIDGAGGNDLILGGSGADFLTGGAGSDSFVYTALSDSRRSAQDTILDFTVGCDKLDLRALDANTNVVGNSDFIFIGEAAFSKHAGELHVTHADADHTLVSGDVDGDGRADFSITLLGDVYLAATDFVL